MSKEYKLIVDSMADVPIDYKNENLVVIPTPVTIGGLDYTNATPDQFYDKMEQVKVMNRQFVRDGKEPIRALTSAPNPTEIAEVMKEIIESGKDAIYVATSAGLTSAFNSGRMAVSMMADYFGVDYERKAVAVNGDCMSILTFLLVKDAMKECDSTRDFLEYVFYHRNDMEHSFVLTDFSALKQSGRVPANKIDEADRFKLKTLFRFDFNSAGEREVIVETAFTMAEDLYLRMANMMKKTISPSEMECVIVNAQNLKAARELYDVVVSYCPEVSAKEGVSYRMSPATGVHLGGSAIGLAYMRRGHVYQNAEFKKSLQNSRKDIYGYLL